MNNLDQLLIQAQSARDVADWSLLIQYLQQLMVAKVNPERLLELALPILEMGDFQQRWDITKVLTQLGIIAIPPLIEILEDEDADEELRWYAAKTLGEFQHPDVIRPLVELLKKSDDEELKVMAATALGQIGTPAVAALSELLNQEQTRLLAVRSLAYIRTPEIITSLLAVVQDTQPSVRTAAIEALSSFHDERIPPVLLLALDDVSATVRSAAVIGLGFRSDLCTELGLVTRLQPKLYDLNLEVCCAATVALARMNCDEAAKQLFQVLLSPHTPIALQLEVIRALIWVETLSGLAYLQQSLLRITSQELWQEIVTVLGQVQKPQFTTVATEILLDMLQRQHPATKITSIKNAIALSLGQLGNKQAIEPLTLLLSDPDEVVRLYAIAALNKLTGEVAHQ